MGKSNAHLLLEQKAKDILINKGFSDNEIFREFRFTDMIIDYVGIKKNLKVAIECGTVYRADKIPKLKESFDIVIHLKYDNSDKTTFLLTVDDGLWKKFKAKMTHDKSLNQALVDLIERVVKNEKK